MNKFTIFSVGHSTHSFGTFIELLRSAEVNAVADVRSVPWSKHFPHFNRKELKEKLEAVGVQYRFFGKMLGGRPDDPSLFDGTVADYEAMAKSEDFAKGIVRVISGAKKYNLTLMCSEHDPLDCHRCLLVGRELLQQGGIVKHILASGNVVTQQEIESYLLQNSGRFSDDLYLPRDELIKAAYRERARKVAFRDRSEEQNTETQESDVEYR